MYYFSKNEPTKWGVVKVQHFSDWRFEPHYNYIFSDLMCWFFETLNEDLAKKHDLKPSPYNSLKKHGCLDLKYDDIISNLRTNIRNDMY